MEMTCEREGFIRSHASLLEVTCEREGFIHSDASLLEMTCEREGFSFNNAPLLEREGSLVGLWSDRSPEKAVWIAFFPPS